MDELNFYNKSKQQELDLQMWPGFESRGLCQSGEVSFANVLLVQRTTYDSVFELLFFFLNFLCLDTYLCNFLHRSRE